MHVHVYCQSGEAKFWMESDIELAQNYGINGRDIREARNIIEEHADEIRSAWEKHFSR